MIVTDDDDVARLLRSLINQGRGDDGGWLVHDRLGFNYRMDELSAAVGLGQVEKLDLLLDERRLVAERYGRLLRDIDGVELPWSGAHMRGWFVYVVRLAPEIDRAAVLSGLAAGGVSARPYLPTIHLQPAYRELGFGAGMFPVAERVAAATVALPFFVGLGEDDQAQVAAVLREVLDGL